MKKQSIYEDYKVVINDDNSVSVFKKDELCSNSTAALCEIASKVGFTIEEKWNTRQTGSKLVDFLNSNAPQPAAKKKQELRIEAKYTGHIYVARDKYRKRFKTCFRTAVDDDNSPLFIELYLDDKFLKDGGDSVTYGDARSLDLEKFWDDNEINCYEFLIKGERVVWFVDVEDFDEEKLRIELVPYDIQLPKAGYNKRRYRIKGVWYNDVELEENLEWCEEESNGYSYIWDFEDYISEKYGYRYYRVNGKYMVELNDKWGLIDIFDNTILPFEYEDCKGYEDGLLAVKLSGKWGFVDESGNEKIPFEYEDTNGFSEGLCAVKLNGKWGFINLLGEVFIPFKYEDCEGGFKNEICPVQLDGKWGVISVLDDVVIPFKYDWMSEFKDGQAEVELDGETFYIDEDGNEVDPDDDDDYWD